MQTPASIAKHPIHPMLITLPIGLWVFSLICDLIFVFGGRGEAWSTVAFYTMGGGLVGALLAAIPGFIDLLSLPAPIKRVAITHMSVNLGVVVLYAINLWLRARGSVTYTPQWLSVIAVVALGFSGWLGGKMVHVHGVAVQEPPEPVSTMPARSPERRHAERRMRFQG